MQPLRQPAVQQPDDSIISVTRDGDAHVQQSLAIPSCRAIVRKSGYQFGIRRVDDLLSPQRA